jgi:succinylglutamic semialdehyde dehydrogenase
VLRAWARAIEARRTQFYYLLAIETGCAPARAAALLDAALWAFERLCAQAPEVLAPVGSSPGTASAGAGWRSSLEPLGVVAVVTPFVDPIGTALARVVPALAAGNTVVLKPSEKATLTAQLLAEAWLEAVGGPPEDASAFALLPGEREVGRRLCAHSGVDAVFFTGSYDVAVRIRQDTLQQSWKRLVLESGGKNAFFYAPWGPKDPGASEAPGGSLRPPQQDFEAAIEAVAEGAFSFAGQDCRATSLVFVPETHLEEFVSGLRARAERLVPRDPAATDWLAVRHATENGGNSLGFRDLAPLIDRAAVDRALKALGVAAREGCRFALRGASVSLGGSGSGEAASCFVSPSIVLPPKLGRGELRRYLSRSVFHQAELQAPVVSVFAVEDWEHALELASELRYGLAASVFTRSPEVFEKARGALRVGWVHQGFPTTYGAHRLPSSARGKSGYGLTASPPAPGGAGPEAVVETLSPWDLMSAVAPVHSLVGSSTL